MRNLIESRLLLESAITKKWVDGVKKWWKQWVKRAGSVSKLQGEKHYKKVMKYIEDGEARLQRLKDDLDYKKGALAFPEFMMKSRKTNIKHYKGLDPRVDFVYMFSDASEKLHDIKRRLETWYNVSYVPDSHDRKMYGYDPKYKFGKNQDLNAYDADVESLPDSVKEVDSIVSGRLFRRLNKFITDYESIMGPEAEKTLGTEGESEVAIGRVKVIINSGPRDPHGISSMGKSMVHPSLTKQYIGEIKKAKALLDKAGLGKAWYGDFFIQPDGMAREVIGARSGKSYREGAHWSWKDHVVLFGKPRATLHKTIVHELGHRWYFKVMTQGERSRFDSYFGGAPYADDIPVPIDPPAGKVRAVSDYGGESSVEDFAEVFAWYVTGKKLTSDQRDRFKQFALKGGKIRRNEEKEMTMRELVEKLSGHSKRDLFVPQIGPSTKTKDIQDQIIDAVKGGARGFKLGKMTAIRKGPGWHVEYDGNSGDIWGTLIAVPAIIKVWTGKHEWGDVFE